MTYFLVITYPGSGNQILMHAKDKAVAATPANKEILLDMGKKLLSENVISSYQLVVTVGSEIN